MYQHSLLARVDSSLWEYQWDSGKIQLLRKTTIFLIYSSRQNSFLMHFTTEISDSSAATAAALN